MSAASRRVTRALLALAVTGLAAGGGLVAVPAGASAAPGSCQQSKGVYPGETPWEQRLLDPQAVWPLTRGRGVTVAVVGTGVNAADRQLAGRVSGSATTDCDGRGTVAAGMVAAAPDGSTTFTGLAPAARIVSVRYTQTLSNTSGGPSPDDLAKGIETALKSHPSVICVAVTVDSDSGKLAAAIADAHRADAVVVSPARMQGNGRTYPTADGDVLGVAAVGDTGAAASTEAGDYIDVAAPGAGVVAAAPTGTGQLWPVKDPSAAAGYAAGAVALLRAYRPTLSADAAVDRLEQTATHVAADGRDPRLGFGVVDPYAAVTTELPAGPGASRSAGGPVAAATAPVSTVDSRRGLVLVLGFGGVVLGIVLALGVTVVRRGRARGWRPARRA